VLPADDFGAILIASWSANARRDADELAQRNVVSKRSRASRT